MTVFVEGLRCACPDLPGGCTAWHTALPERGLMVSTINWHARSVFGPEGSWYLTALTTERCSYCGQLHECGTGPLLAHGDLEGSLSDGGMAEFHGYLVARVRAGMLP